MLPVRWPKWSIIVIALALGAFAIGLVLLLEPLARAVSPKLAPTPTLQLVQYARQVSDGCEDCHFDQSALLDSAETGANVEAAWIEAESLATPHGSLGCITCHGGTGSVADKEEAHQGLIEDLSETHPQDCQVCHSAGSYKSCFNCHVGKDAEGLAYFKTDPSQMTFKIGRNPLKSDERPWDYVLVRHVPTARDTFAFYGEDLLPDYDNVPTWKYAPVHNIRRVTPQNQECNNCHGNAELFLSAADVPEDELDANESVIVKVVPPAQ